MEAPKLYRIKRETLTDIADIARKMTGRIQKLTPEEFIYWLNRVIVIPQGYAGSIQSVSQNSSARGIVPAVVRGRAVSAQSVSNTSNAVGFLVEAT